MTTNTPPKHPAHGTCVGCTQGKRVDKYGRIREHSYTAASGGLLLTLTCPGSNGPYAEYARTQWNARLSRWQDMPIQVDAFMHMTADQEPEEIYVEVFPSVEAKRGHARFVERGLSLHFLPVFKAGDEEPSEFRTELRNRDGRCVLDEPPVANDGDSVSPLVLRLMEQIGTDAVVTP